MLRIDHQRDIDDTIMMRVIHRMSQKYPGINTTVKHAFPSDLKSDLSALRCDAAFYLEPRSRSTDNSQMRTLSTSRMQLIVPVGHPFAQRESVDIRELETETVIMLNRKVSPLIVDLVNSRCVEHGFSLKADHYVSDAANGYALVAAGKGISFMHSMAAESIAHAATDVSFVNLEDPKLLIDYVVQVRTDLPEDLKAALHHAIDELLQNDHSLT